MRQQLSHNYIRIRIQLGYDKRKELNVGLEKLGLVR